MRSIDCDGSVVEILAAALDRTGSVVATINDTALQAPSTCEGWSVSEVVGHVIAVTEKFNAFARGETDTPRRHERTDGNVRAHYAAAADASRAAWRGTSIPEACHLSFGVFDRWTAAAINAFDVCVHGWDLACSTGVPYAVDDSSGALALSVARLLATPQGRRDGQYGAEQSVAATAAPFERALALTGRVARGDR